MTDNDDRLFSVPELPAATRKKAVEDYEGTWTKCFRCGNKTVPKTWPLTRLCFPCIDAGYYEYGGIIYYEGKKPQLED